MEISMSLGITSLVFTKQKDLFDEHTKTSMKSNFPDEVFQWTPHLKLPVKGVNSLLIYVVNETPFEMANL